MIRVTKIKTRYGHTANSVQERFIAQLIKDALGSEWAKNAFRHEFNTELTEVQMSIWRDNRATWL